MSHEEKRRQLCLLAENDIASAIATLGGRWERDGQTLRRVIPLNSYPEALALFKPFVEIAERYGHHPDIIWTYAHVCVQLTTHDLGGISNLDFDVAQELERCIASLTANT